MWSWWHLKMQSHLILPDSFLSFHFNFLFFVFSFMRDWNIFEFFFWNLERIIFDDPQMDLAVTFFGCGGPAFETSRGQDRLRIFIKRQESETTKERSKSRSLSFRKVNYFELFNFFTSQNFNQTYKLYGKGTCYRL